MTSKLPLPREHGAWAMVLAPAVVGLARGSAAAWQWVSLLAALLAAFVAQDALVRRLTQQRSAPDGKWLWALASLGLLSAAPLLLAGVWELLWLALGAAVYLVAHVVRIRLVGRRAHRHLAFETLTVAVLCTGAVAGGMVAGTDPLEWAFVYGASLVMFAGSTFHVRALLRARKARKSGRLRPASLAVESLWWHGLVLVTLLTWTALGGSAWLWLGFGPLVIRALVSPWVLAGRDPSLKAAGFGELGLTLLWAGSLWAMGPISGGA